MADYIFQFTAEIDKDAEKKIEKQIKDMSKKLPDLKMDIAGADKIKVRKFEEYEEKVKGVRTTTTRLEADIDKVRHKYKLVEEDSKHQEDTAASLRKKIIDAGAELRDLQKQLNKQIADGTGIMSNTLQRNIRKVEEEFSELQKSYTKIVGSKESRTFTRQARLGYLGEERSGASKRQSDALKEYSRIIKKVTDYKIKQAKIEKQIEEQTGNQKRSLNRLLERNKKLIEQENKRASAAKRAIQGNTAEKKAEVAKEEQALRLQEELNRLRKPKDDSSKSFTEFSKYISKATGYKIEQAKIEKQIEEQTDEEKESLTELLSSTKQLLDIEEKRANTALKGITDKDKSQKAQLLIQEQELRLQKELARINKVKPEKDLDDNYLTEYSKALHKLTNYKISLTKLQKRAEKGNEDEAQSIEEITKALEDLVDKEQKRADVAKANIINKQAEATNIYQEENIRLQTALLDLNKAEEEVTETGFGLADMITNSLVNEAINMLQRALSEAVGKIKELNKAMTDVQMVTGSTAEQTAKLAKTYSKMAGELGATTTQMAAGASDWLRQGKSASETTDLLTASTVMSKIGMIEAAEATELLTSTMNGYKKSTEDAMHIVDAMSAVDLAAATSVEEIATALQKTANIARVSGVDFETLVGYVSAVSEATRQAPEIIGTSFKTLFSRYSNIAAGKNIDDFGESIDICGIQA